MKRFLVFLGVWLFVGANAVVADGVMQTVLIACLVSMGVGAEAASWADRRLSAALRVSRVEVPGGVLEVPFELSHEQRDDLIAKWNAIRGAS